MGMKGISGMYASDEVTKEKVAEYAQERWITPTHRSILQLSSGSGGVILAGGYLRDRFAKVRPKDADFWFKSRVVAEATGHWLRSIGWETEARVDEGLIHCTPPPSETAEVPIQLVSILRFTDALDLLSTFDFSICQVALWWDETGVWKSEWTDGYAKDTESTTLRYIQGQHAGGMVGGHAGSLARMFKFWRRGYLPDEESLCELLAKAAGRMTSPTRYDEWKGLMAKVEDYGTIQGHGAEPGPGPGPGPEPLP